MQSRNTNNLKGIDVSNHQASIDFSEVKASGIDIVYMKATEGVGYVDSYLNINYQNAKENGLKVGFYHFFTPLNEEDTRAEAQAFYNAIKDKESDCKYCLDIENTYGLSRETLSHLARLFMEEIKKLTGKDAVLYTYTSFARENLDNSLSNYSLWIAHYGVNTPGDNPIWSSWIGFQYADNGSVNGINGNTDMDEFTPDILFNSSSISTIVEPQQSNNVTTVSDIQSILNSRYGFKISVDNIQGSETFKAIVKGIQIELNKQFDKGLDVDGVPGPKTLGSVVTLRKDANGNLTWLMQALLICKGYNLGKFGADSDFGYQTKIAVQNFQAAHKLTADGIVGANTWRVLLGL